MSEDNDDLPDIDLHAKQEELKAAILNDPEEGWQLLQSDPAMVLAFTRVKRDLQDMEENDNVLDFFEQFNQHSKLIFGHEYPLDRYGIALACELLTEYWRQSVNSPRMSSINEGILKKMVPILEAADQLPAGEERKIVHKIVDFSTQRVIDFVDYNREKGKEHLVHVEPELQQMVQNVIQSNDMEKILSLAYFASASTESLEVFRDQLASILLNDLKDKFPHLEEEDKFKIAPYLGVFERITESDTE